MHSPTHAACVLHSQPLSGSDCIYMYTCPTRFNRESPVVSLVNDNLSFLHVYVCEVAQRLLQRSRRSSRATLNIEHTPFSNLNLHFETDEMMSSEFVVGVIFGSISAGLCLCLLTISIVTYICRKQGVPRHGSLRLFWPQNDKDSDCEKGYEPLEPYQDEKKSGSVVVEVLPVDAPLVDVEETYDSKYVAETTLLENSDVETELVTVKEPLIYDDENPWPTPGDRVASVRALVAAKDEDTRKQFQNLADGCQLEDFNFAPWLRNPSTPLIYTPSAPTIISSTKAFTRKTKRSWHTSDGVDANFGSMQVKGIREVREDRPRQRDY